MKFETRKRCSYGGANSFRLVCEELRADLLHIADETLFADLLHEDVAHKPEKQEKIRRETMEDDNGITIYTIGQKLLNAIDLTMTAFAPDLEDLQRTQIAVATYKKFREALCIKKERGTYN